MINALSMGSRLRLLPGLLAMVVAMVVVLAVGVAAAAASPAWSVNTLARPTSLSSAQNGNQACESGGVGSGINKFRSCDRYTVLLTNVGAADSLGTITVKDTLPEGVTTSHPPAGENALQTFSWQCTTETIAPHEIVTCESANVVPALSAAAALEIPVNIDPGIPAGALLTNRVEVTGGEAAEVTNTSQSVVAKPPTTFGPSEFIFSALDQSGGLDTRAAGHPASLVSSFSFPTVYSDNAFRGNKTGVLEGVTERATPLEDVRQIVTDLAPGVVGDALATPTCSLADISDLTAEATQCPAASRIGTLVVVEGDQTYSELIIFNVTPEPGHAAEFAVFLPNFQRSLILYATVVGTGAGAHARVVASPQPNDFLLTSGISLAFYGQPNVINKAPLRPVAFATNPADCGAAGFTSTMYVDTWEHPGRLLPNGDPDLSDTTNWKSASTTAPPVTGCNELHFNPSLTFAPEPGHGGADEPAGYESTLQIPQNEDAAGLATPPLRTAVVTLPPGVAISPSAANGLVGCEESGGNGIGLDNNEPGNCPQASSVGDVSVKTPLLKEVLTGSVYVAEPTCGGAGQPECTEEAAELGHVFALFIEVGSSNSGVHLKLRGQVEVGGQGHHNNLAPGQVRTTFADTPQEPFSQLTLRFHGGPGAPLANPQTCGTFAAEASLTPWSSTASAPSRPTPPFAISGCEGTFAPPFGAGTTLPRAGGFAPFSVTLRRRAREQNLSGLTVNLPEGLAGQITGVAECSDAQANAGTCAADSMIGTANAAAGSGSSPYWQSGPVYLTGPYHGAPFGLSVVVPAKAGPYNLGNIVVRAAIFIDPHTAQVTVVSDPLPQAVDGVPLRVQTINVTVGGQRHFSFNPTSCEPKQVTATVSGAMGGIATVASRFQAAECTALRFTPKISVSTAAKASKTNGAGLSFKIAYPSGAMGTQSWFNEAKLSFPKQMPARLTTIQKACVASVFDVNPSACPPASVIGHASVHTEVLPVPLSGPVYFVSHGGAKFPDVVMVLQGDNVRVDLVGETLIRNGVTSATFRNTPDVPFESIEVTIPPGPFSEFGAFLPAKAKFSFCGQKLKIPTVLKAANGAEIHQQTPIAVTGCRATHTKKKKHRARSGRGRRASASYGGVLRR